MQSFNTLIKMYLLTLIKKLFLFSRFINSCYFYSLPLPERKLMLGTVKLFSKLARTILLKAVKPWLAAAHFYCSCLLHFTHSMEQSTKLAEEALDELPPHPQIRTTHPRPGRKPCWSVCVCFCWRFAKSPCRS